MNSTYCIFTWLGKHDAMNNIVNLCKPCDIPTMHANSIVSCPRRSIVISIDVRGGPKIQQGVGRPSIKWTSSKAWTSSKGWGVLGCQR